MASTDFLNKAYLAYFGRPIDFDGAIAWGGSVTEEQVAAGFAASAESVAIYGDKGVTLSYINAVYQNLFNRPAELNGATWWLQQIQSGKVTAAGAAMSILNAALTGPDGTDKTIVTNKLAASQAFFAALDTTQENLAYTSGVASARAFLHDVDVIAMTAAQITDAVLAATSTPVVTSNEILLTVGQDSLTGTALVDTFKANVVQNANGAQVNTLGSGDVLNGSSQYDTLDAKITAGVFAGQTGYSVGSSATMPIQPQTTSIENIKLQAVNSSIAGAALATEVYVNAKDMTGITKIASNHSDANLTIQNLTTKDDAGVARAVSTMTVGMEYTGNADHGWSESDLHVYFDQDYLTTQTQYSVASVDFKLMNEDAYDQTQGARPLDGVVVAQMDIHLNGKVYHLAPYLALTEPVTGALADGSQISTYDQQLAAVNKAIDALKLDNPTDAALQSLVAKNGAVFTSDISPTTGQLRVGTAVTLTVEGATNGVKNTLEVSGTDLQLVRAPVVTAIENNNRYERAEQTPQSSSEILKINVALEKVGLAGDGGDLVIGSMNKTVENKWDAVNTVTNTVSGIQEFDVTVYGANDKSSSLTSLASTNNNLTIVKVVTDAALTGTSFADLTIGNSQTQTARVVGAAPSADNAAALKDVQTFDASTFKGDLTLFAALTAEVEAKYLQQGDVQVNPVTDNVAFTYTGGTGDDYINLHLDSSNLALPGTATREDLTLSVNGGDGNDELVVQIGNNSNNTHWYANQEINSNLKVVAGVAQGQLQIDAGAGDDVVRTLGFGDYAINGGTGADTFYVDNTGKQALVNVLNDGKAVWVYNDDATDVGSPYHDVQNLLSQDTSGDQSGIVNLNLTVNFLGFTAKVAVAKSSGVTTGVTVNDLTINQSIKDAINNDAVLNKLLIAEDGPGRTLVVHSLIDGAAVASDLTVSLSSDALNAAQLPLAATLHLITDAQLAALGFAANGSAVVAAGYDSVLGQEVNGAVATTITGANSTSSSDSIVAPGTGLYNDVIVLSTGADSNDTVAISGLANGNDTIVNFEASGSSIDRIDFSSYGVTAVYDGATLMAGTAIDLAGTGTYIQLTESATNAGSYAVTLVDLGAKTVLTDTIISVVGNVDFGFHQDFIANNSFTIVAGAYSHGVTPVGPVVPPTPGYTDKIVDGLGTDVLAATFSAAGAALKLIDTMALANNVIVTGYGADDLISISGTTLALYGDGISSNAAGDVNLKFNDGLGHVSEITLVGVNVGGGAVNSIATFNALAIGDIVLG